MNLWKLVQNICRISKNPLQISYETQVIKSIKIGKISELCNQLSFLMSQIFYNLNNSNWTKNDEILTRAIFFELGNFWSNEPSVEKNYNFHIISSQNGQKLSKSNQKWWNLNSNWNISNWGSHVLKKNQFLQIITTTFQVKLIQIEALSDADCKFIHSTLISRCQLIPQLW